MAHRLQVGLLLGVHELCRVPCRGKMEPNAGHDGLGHTCDGVSGAGQLARDGDQRGGDTVVTGESENVAFVELRQLWRHRLLVLEDLPDVFRCRRTVFRDGVLFRLFLALALHLL